MDEDEHAVFYINLATIHKDGHLRRVWTLEELKQTTADGVTSTREFDEYDCNEKRGRTFLSREHSEPTVDGRAPRSVETPDAKWNHIPSYTPAEAILRRVCAR